jgi:DNA-binding Xre family transcriptional regulator
MTYNWKETRSPMERIQAILQKEASSGIPIKDLAETCSTTPATMSKWINNGADLKWYSLLDICKGLDLKLSDILKDTVWEEVA